MRLARFTWSVGVLSLLLPVFVPGVDAAPITLPTHWTLERAEITSSQVDTGGAPGSNAIVDLFTTGPGTDVWAATGRGVSRYSIRDTVWITSGVADGLGADEIPALHVINDGGPIPRAVWASTSHTEVFEKQAVPYGNGIFLSLNGGESWIDVSPDGKRASGPFQVCFDIASFRGAVLAACFAGGLVISADQGETWKNIFASAADRRDFEDRKFRRLNNRFFSVIVDSTVPESLAVYAGSAEGINKFIFLDSSLKVTGRRFQALAQDGSRLYLGSEGGLSVTSTRGGSWRTYYSEDGLPSNNIAAIAAAGDTILVGADSEPGVAGAGLAVSYDQGGSWTVSQPPQAVGEGRRARSIVSAAGAWWAACEQGGLIRSDDNGGTWINIFPDSTLAADFRNNDPPLSAANRVNTLLAVTLNDTTRLYAGTDSGIVVYTVPMDTLPVSASINTIGAESATGLGQRVVKLQLQDSTSDNTVLWSLNQVTPSHSDRTPGYAVSLDGGETWRVIQAGFSPNDIAFFNNDFYLATDLGLRRGVYPIIEADSLTRLSGFESLVDAGRVSANLRAIATEVTQSTSGSALTAIWAASDSGLAFSFDGGAVWGVIFSNPDPFEFDRIVRSVYRGRDTLDAEKFVSLSGNFVTALGLQRFSGRRIIWAATQTTGGGQRNGLSKSEDGGLNWTVPITGHRVWNFAFDGPEVWAATTEGLLHSPDAGAAWDTLRAFIDPNNGASIDSLTENFGVAVVGNEVWVGTANGLAVLDKAQPDSVIRVRRTFASTDRNLPSGEGGAYATPVPFSPNFHPNGVRFHYTPPVTGPVTITIFDFANRSVKVVTRGQERQAGVQYDEADVWDGRNGNGRAVAVGTYFFVIEYANGQKHWGKLAVIP